MLQQNPIVVDIVQQPPPAPDISVDVVLGMFMMAGVILLAAAIGSVIVAGAIILYRRWRDGSEVAAGPTHTQLGI